MPDEADACSSRPPASSSPPAHFAYRADGRLLRLLSNAEHAILYVVCAVLLSVAVIIMVQLGVTIVRIYGSWLDIIIVSIEELLLVLIVLEIFVTVLTHLRGGHLLLEPFIIVGIIVVIRHILSVVVKLTVVQTPHGEREELVELGAYAGAAFLLTAALALSRWSRKWPSEMPGPPSEGRSV
ncbi:phosphate-starvation-inducible PsiE family protein [Streptosporangium soli]|nr:phosphate-starvation-inducible PsiE family protein [Streptosporangium sp. KLBMP 9127]